MSKTYFILFIIFPLFGLKAKSQTLTLPTPTNYESGHHLFERQGSVLSFEKGSWTAVPVDYNNPEGDKFDIYSWFAAEYNPLLPTVVYFTGGPGQGSHWGQSALESKSYNLLFMDQRGISLSKPARLSDYLNPHFYNSEWTAMDLEVLRQKLNISKLSIYAISYGTIPATIYASRFPSFTTALVLEGTAFSAKHLATFDEKKKMITAVIQKQKSEIQKKIYDLHTESGLKSTWFFQWCRDTLLLNDGLTAISDQLALLGDSEEYTKFVELLKTQYTPHSIDFNNDLYGMNDIPYYMISCQELGLSLPTTQTDLDFKNNSIVETRNDNDTVICRSLNAQTMKLYEANSFPLTVPVTYFQGENDPATEISGALMHFQNVAKGFKQILTLKNGGHNPSLQLLGLDEPAQREIVELALRGEIVTVGMVTKANLVDPALQWKIRYK